MTDTPAASRRVRILSAVACGTLWAGALTATHIPADDLPEVVPVSDKVLHMAGYFVLAAALGLTLRLRGVTARRVAILVPIVMMMYGAFDELTQPLPMFNRSASWGDWLADVVGGVIGVLACIAVFNVCTRTATRSDGD